jgi:UDP-N-acetylenolpyruvoylglucosamine reductase
LRLNIPFSIIANALSRYEGTGRRFDVRYEDPQVMVVDDYAHHPTEIQKTLLAARSLGRRRNLVLFQPHRYSRTGSFLKEFGASFESADKIVITDIYAASEAPLEGVSGRAVAEAIRDAGHRDVSFVERNRLTRFAQDQIQSGDLIITMGAGDITEVSAELASSLKNRSLSLKTPNGDAGSDLSRIRGKVAFEEPLSKHTTLRVGGPAQIWIEPQDDEDLKLALKICRDQSLKLHLFGAGSNLLAPDEGLRGMVVGLGSPYFREMSLREGRVVARAGVPNSLFIQFALENGFGGCEFLTGIPGNVGGAIAMNAGSHGQSVQEILESTRLMAFSGEEREYLNREIPFGYRDSGIRRRVILEGTFLLPKLPREICQRKLDEYRDYRQRTQDLQHPSAGCMFKNPLRHGASSGKLIEDAGFKGRRIGNAQVSPIHANFIINLGGATARDVIQLMDEVQRGVREKYQIDLESEVKIL